MKIFLHDLLKNQKWFAMPAVLSLLLVGSLIIAPLLTHVGSGAKATQIHEQRMAELYAADAGVENAL